MLESGTSSETLSPTQGTLIKNTGWRRKLQSRAADARAQYFAETTQGHRRKLAVVPQ